MEFIPYVRLTSELGDHIFELKSDVSPKHVQLAGQFLDQLRSCAGNEESDFDELVSGLAEIAKLRLDCDLDDEDIRRLGRFWELSEFLDESSDVKMLLRQEPDTIQQLINCAAEGGLNDEWTQEFVARDADENLLTFKNALSADLSPENCFAAIRLLLLCYPRERVLPIIDSFVAASENEDLKEQAMFLALVFEPEK